MNGIYFLVDKILMSDNVLIYYGAAPFISDKIVNDVIRITELKGSAVTATPRYQLIGSLDDNVSKKRIDRDSLMQIASPYGFRYEYLLDICKRAKEKVLIERIEPHTTSLMYALGKELNLAYWDQTNIKITTKEYIDLFEG